MNELSRCCYYEFNDMTIVWLFLDCFCFGHCMFRINHKLNSWFENNRVRLNRTFFMSIHNTEHTSLLFLSLSHWKPLRLCVYQQVSMVCVRYNNYQIGVCKWEFSQNKETFYCTLCNTICFWALQWRIFSRIIRIDFRALI